MGLTDKLVEAISWPKRALNARNYRTYKTRIDELLSEILVQKAILSNFRDDENDGNDMLRQMYNLGKTEDPHYNLITILNNELKTLSGLLDSGKDRDIASFVEMIALKKENKDSIHAFREFFDNLSKYYENGVIEIVGTPVQDKIISTIIDRDCVFTEKAKETPYSEIGQSVREEYKEFIKQMRRVYNFDIDNVMRTYLGILSELREEIKQKGDYKGLKIDFTRTIPSLSSFMPTKKKRGEEKDKFKVKRQKNVELKKQIAQLSDWDSLDQIIADYHNKTKQLDEADVFTVMPLPMGGITIVPIRKGEKITLADICGYETEKELIKHNTELLVNNEEANNIFIYGPPGTGKSMLMNALQSEYANKGLKFIQIRKEWLTVLPTLFRQIEATDYKFIVLLDEMEFEKGEKRLAGEMRKIIEGSFNSIPKNVRIYAISNDPHGLRAKKEDDANVSSAPDKSYLALEDRFGLKVEFHKPDETEQQMFLRFYLRKNQISQDNYGDIWKGFQEYCSGQKITDPNIRNIKNYVTTLKPTEQVQKI